MFNFFRKKENVINVGIKKLKEFRDIGEKFNYLGVELIVEDHTINSGFGFIPAICACYRDNSGDLRHVTFFVKDLVCLKAENPE